MRLSLRSPTALWMAAAFSVTLAVAVGVRMIDGAGQSGVIAALRSTARVAYLFFWPAYIGGALATLYGNAFRSLASRARQFGLAFAASLLVHVGLVVWLIAISPNRSLLATTMPFFMIGVIWTYLLAATSIDRVRAFCGPYALTVLRTVGVEYIALVFFADFVVLPQNPLQYPILYVPFWIMLGLGLALRLGAAMKRVHRTSMGPGAASAP